MHSTRAEQSRQRSESLVCRGWFGEAKETKSDVKAGGEGGEGASEGEEEKEAKTKYSKLFLSLAVDAVRYSLVENSRRF